LIAHAGGPITQSGAITAVEGTFTVDGNHGIALTASNLFSGKVGFNNADADNSPSSAVTFTNNTAGGTLLATSSLGLSTFSVTALQGSLSQVGGTKITQERGAGQATFIANTGTGIFLNATTNRLEGAVSFVGPNVTTVALTNTSTLASLAALPATVSNLTLK